MASRRQAFLWGTVPRTGMLEASRRQAWGLGLASPLVLADDAAWWPGGELGHEVPSEGEALGVLVRPLGVYCWLLDVQGWVPFKGDLAQHGRDGLLNILKVKKCARALRMWITNLSHCF